MDPDDMIGATLGNYRVIAKLGQGGMGAVYLAEHPLLGRKAAVKLLLSGAVAAEGGRRSASSTRRGPPRACATPRWSMCSTSARCRDGRAFLIMEYLEGECLEARIQARGPLPARQALGIARQIALGVSVAHAEQHRSPRPQAGQHLPVAARGRRPGASG